MKYGAERRGNGIMRKSDEGYIVETEAVAN